MTATAYENDELFEFEPFCDKQKLYLKPIARITVTIKLPKVAVPGQSISNWDLMERLKKTVNPIQLENIKVMESSLEFVIFEAELISRPFLKQTIKLLDGVTLKVSGFSEPLRVSASEAKVDFPSRHDWDIFYMKNKLDETKPGERPDTLYINKIPVKWFYEKSQGGPSESFLFEAMSTFGKLREVDIPMCDPIRHLMPPKISGIQTKQFGFGQELFFEAYIQYESYSGFTAAMAGLRNMKWSKKIDGKVFFANVKVDFDRTKHLSETNILKRKLEREKIRSNEKKQKLNDDKERIEREEQIRREEEEKERRREERERKRKERREEERKKEEERKRLEIEEREADKRYIRDMGLQSQRVLDCVFKRIQDKEDKKCELKEKQLKCDQQIVVLDELDASMKEEKLREMLLLQREIRMRERLKQKLQHKTSERSPSPVDRRRRDSSSSSRDSRRHRRSRSRSRGKHRRSS